MVSNKFLLLTFEKKLQFVITLEHKTRLSFEIECYIILILITYLVPNDAFILDTIFTMKAHGGRTSTIGGMRLVNLSLL